MAGKLRPSLFFSPALRGNGRRCSFFTHLWKFSQCPSPSLCLGENFPVISGKTRPIPCLAGGKSGAIATNTKKYLTYKYLS